MILIIDGFVIVLSILLIVMLCWQVIWPVLHDKPIFWVFRRCGTKLKDDLHQELHEERERSDAVKLAKEILKEKQSR